MAFSKTEKIAFDIAQPIAEENGCFIYDVEFVREGGSHFLRIYADRESGIDLDACEVISRAVSKKLDEVDPISQDYYLEVSSPGIERKLKTKEHFERYIGEKIDIGLYKAINGSKTLCGVLKDFDGENISVQVGDEVLEISQKQSTRVNLHFDF